MLSTFSRLLIDPNRGADDPTLVMRYSDGAIVPGNARVDAAEIARRRARYWTPYREAVASTIEAMLRDAASRRRSSRSIPSRRSGAASPRPLEDRRAVGPATRARRAAARALAAEADLTTAAIGDNEPYDGALDGDTIDAIATARGLANALIEVRQDLIAEPAGATPGPTGSRASWSRSSPTGASTSARISAAAPVAALAERGARTPPRPACGERHSPLRDGRLSTPYG